MKTSIFYDATSFRALQQAWDDLHSRSTSNLIFTTHLYQQTWWQYLGNDDLVLIAVWNETDDLVGLAPLYGITNEARQRQLNFVGCVDVSDYLDLLVDKGYVEEVYGALLDCLDNEQLAWDKISLCSLPQGSTTHTQFARTARARGWEVEVRQQDVCPVITLADSWDSYLAEISKKQRHEIRRKIRKLESESESSRWYVVDDETDLNDAMTAFIELHQKSARHKENFWNDALVEFFSALAAKMVKSGWFKLFFLELNGVKAAAIYCFDYDNQFLLYNSGYDPDQYAHLSPGNVLVAYSIQEAIRLGRPRYDFLRGDEVYKFRFGAEAEPVYDLEICRAVRE